MIVPMALRLSESRLSRAGRDRWKRGGGKKLVREVLVNGASAREILDRGLLAGIDILGKRFKAGGMFISDVLLSTRCMWIYTWVGK